MSGSSALRAEVFNRFHQSVTKNLFPETVDDRPRGERIFFVHQPLRKTQPIVRSSFREGIQCMRYLRTYCFAFDKPVATIENIGRSLLVVVVFNHDGCILNFSI